MMFRKHLWHRMSIIVIELECNSFLHTKRSTERQVKNPVCRPWPLIGAQNRDRFGIRAVIQIPNRREVQNRLYGVLRKKLPLELSRFLVIEKTSRLNQTELSSIA